MLVEYEQYENINYYRCNPLCYLKTMVAEKTLAAYNKRKEYPHFKYPLFKANLVNIEDWRENGINNLIELFYITLDPTLL